MTTQDVLTSLFLGITFGAIGQCARMIVGIKKTFDEANAHEKSIAEVFDVKQLVVSIIIGAIAGGLASLALVNNPGQLTKESIFGLITAGYAGADFIEGFMRNEETPTKKIGGEVVAPAADTSQTAQQTSSNVQPSKTTAEGEKERE
jgi:uncharacterized membrane protein YeaQ/YmgE (transglycosylase-associated protein family)